MEHHALEMGIVSAHINDYFQMIAEFEAELAEMTDAEEIAELEILIKNMREWQWLAFMDAETWPSWQ